MQWIGNLFEEDYLNKLKVSIEEDLLIELLCDQALNRFLKSHH